MMSIDNITSTRSDRPVPAKQRSSRTRSCRISRQGRGVGVIDPHGDLALDVLDAIPRSRTNDVIYFDPSDREYPIGLNPIAKTRPRRRHHLVILNTITALRGLWSDVWGLGRMQYILQNTLAALLYYDHATLLAVNRMLADERFRKKVLSRVHDPVILAFWNDEFARYDARLKAEAVAPIQNKVGQFGTTQITRNIIGQAKNAIDFRRVLDRGQIFIANLSKGTMGEDNSRLIGSFLVAQFQLAALSRADVDEVHRRPFFLYIDEFQNFTNVDSLASILSEARKYKLALTLAHQYTEQLGEPLRAAVFGNVGTLSVYAWALKMHISSPNSLRRSRHEVSPSLIRTMHGYAILTAAPCASQCTLRCMRPFAYGGEGR